MLHPTPTRERSLASDMGRTIWQPNTDLPDGVHGHTVLLPVLAAANMAARRRVKSVLKCTTCAQGSIPSRTASRLLQSDWARRAAKAPRFLPDPSARGHGRRQHLMASRRSSSGRTSARSRKPATGSSRRSSSRRRNNGGMKEQDAA